MVDMADFLEIIRNWLDTLPASPSDFENADRPMGMGAAHYVDKLSNAERCAHQLLRELDEHDAHYRALGLVYHLIKYDVRHKSNSGTANRYVSSTLFVTDIC